MPEQENTDSKSQDVILGFSSLLDSAGPTPDSKGLVPIDPVQAEATAKRMEEFSVIPEDFSMYDPEKAAAREATKQQIKINQVEKIQAIKAGEAATTDDRQEGPLSATIVLDRQARSLAQWQMVMDEKLKLTPDDPSTAFGWWSTFAKGFTTSEQVEVGPDIYLSSIYHDVDVEARKMTYTSGQGWVRNPSWNYGLLYDNRGDLSHEQVTLDNFLYLNSELIDPLVRDIALSDGSVFNNIQDEAGFDAEAYLEQAQANSPHIQFDATEISKAPNQYIAQIFVDDAIKNWEMGEAAKQHSVASFMGGMSGGLVDMLTDPEELAIIYASALLSGGVGGVVGTGAGIIKGGSKVRKAIEAGKLSFDLAQKARRGTGRLARTKQFLTNANAARREGKHFLASLNQAEAATRSGFNNWARHYVWHTPTNAAIYTKIVSMREAAVYATDEKDFMGQWLTNVKYFAVGDAIILGGFKALSKAKGRVQATALMAHDLIQTHVATVGAVEAAAKGRVLTEQLILGNISSSQYIAGLTDLTKDMSRASKGAVFRQAAGKDAKAVMKKVRASTGNAELAARSRIELLTEADQIGVKFKPGERAKVKHPELVRRVQRQREAIFEQAQPHLRDGKPLKPVAQMTSKELRAEAKLHGLPMTPGRKALELKIKKARIANEAAAFPHQARTEAPLGETPQIFTERPVQQYADMTPAQLKVQAKKHGITVNKGDAAQKNRKALEEKLEAAEARVGTTELSVASDGALLEVATNEAQARIQAVLDDVDIYAGVESEQLGEFLAAFGIGNHISQLKHDALRTAINRNSARLNDSAYMAGANSNPVLAAFGTAGSAFLAPWRAFESLITQAGHFRNKDGMFFEAANIKLRYIADALMDGPIASRYAMLEGSTRGALPIEAAYMASFGQSLEHGGYTKTKAQMDVHTKAAAKAGLSDLDISQGAFSIMVGKTSAAGANKDVAAIANLWKQYRDYWWEVGGRHQLFTPGGKKSAGVAWNVHHMMETAKSAHGSTGWKALARDRAMKGMRRVYDGGKRRKVDGEMRGTHHEGFSKWIKERYSTVTEPKPQVKLEMHEGRKAPRNEMSNDDFLALYFDDAILEKFVIETTDGTWAMLTNGTPTTTKASDAFKDTSLWFVDIADEAWWPFIERDVYTMLDRYQTNTVPRIMESVNWFERTGISGVNTEEVLKLLREDMIKIGEAMPNGPKKAQFLRDMDSGLAAAQHKRDTIINRGPNGSDKSGYAWWMAKQFNKGTGAVLLPFAGARAVAEMGAVILADGFKLMRWPRLAAATFRSMRNGVDKRNMEALWLTTEYQMGLHRAIMDDMLNLGVGPTAKLRTFDRYSTTASRFLINKVFMLGVVSKLTKLQSSIMVADNLITKIPKLKIYAEVRKTGADHRAALRKSGITAREFGLMDKYRVVEESATLQELIDEGYFINNHSFKILDFERIAKERPIANDAVNSYRAMINGIAETLTPTRSASSTPAGSYVNNPFGFMTLSMTNFTLAFTHKLLPYLAQSSAGQQTGFIVATLGLQAMIQGIVEGTKTGDFEGVANKMLNNPDEYLKKSFMQVPIFGMLQYPMFTTFASDRPSSAIPLFGTASPVASVVDNWVKSAQTAYKAVTTSQEWSAKDSSRLLNATPGMSFAGFQLAMGLAYGKELNSRDASIDIEAHKAELDFKDNQGNTLTSIMENFYESQSRD